MKILKFKTFEDIEQDYTGEIEDILNIARDEGLKIYLLDDTYSLTGELSIINCMLIVVGNSGVDISDERFGQIIDEIDKRMINTDIFKKGEPKNYPGGFGHTNDKDIMEYSWSKKAEYRPLTWATKSKRRRPLNESERFQKFNDDDIRDIENILNIAKDQGLNVYYENDIDNIPGEDFEVTVRNCTSIVINNKLSYYNFEKICDEVDDRLTNTGLFYHKKRYFYKGYYYENIDLKEYVWVMKNKNKQLNESKRDDINDILNIARDEGLYIELYPKLTNFERPSEIRISRFYDNDLKSGEIMSSEKFLDICLDILNRLEYADFNNGKIDSGVAYRKSGGINIIEDTKDFLENWVKDSKGIWIHPDVDYIKRFIIS